MLQRSSERLGAEESADNVDKRNEWKRKKNVLGPTFWRRGPKCLKDGGGSSTTGGEPRRGLTGVYLSCLFP